jgi:hypothetical protein
LLQPGKKVLTGTVYHRANLKGIWAFSQQDNRLAFRGGPRAPFQLPMSLLPLIKLEPVGGAHL